MSRVEKILAGLVAIGTIIGMLYTGISNFKARVIIEERAAQNNIELSIKIKDLSNNNVELQKEVSGLNKKLKVSDSTQAVMLKQQRVDKSTLKAHLKLSEKQDEYIKYLEGLIE
jgi:hypothetical protein